MGRRVDIEMACGCRVDIEVACGCRVDIEVACGCRVDKWHLSTLLLWPGRLGAAARHCLQFLYDQGSRLKVRL